MESKPERAQIVLQLVGILHAQRIEAYRAWRGPLPLLGAGLACVPTLIISKGYVLTLAAWLVLLSFQRYQTWKFRQLTTRPVRAVCGRVEELRTHGRGYRRQDGLAFPVVLETWFAGDWVAEVGVGNSGLAKGGRIETEPVSETELSTPGHAPGELSACIKYAPVSLEVGGDNFAEELERKSEHWFRQMERVGLKDPSFWVVDLSRLLHVVRPVGETFLVGEDLLAGVAVGDVVGLVILGDGVSIVTLAREGVCVPRYSAIPSRLAQQLLQK